MHQFCGVGVRSGVELDGGFAGEIEREACDGVRVGRVGSASPFLNHQRVEGE